MIGVSVGDEDASQRAPACFDGVDDHLRVAAGVDDETAAGLGVVDAVAVGLQRPDRPGDDLYGDVALLGNLIALEGNASKTEGDCRLSKSRVVIQI